MPNYLQLLCYLQLCYSRLSTISNFFAFYQTFLSIGHSVSGEYTVKDPGGSLRIVSYHADKEGFHAVVHTSGKNDHSGGVYGGQGHEETGHLHEYAALSAHAAAYWKRTGSRHDQPWLIAFVPGTIRLFLSRIVNVDVSVLYTKGNNGAVRLTLHAGITYRIYICIVNIVHPLHAR